MKPRNSCAISWASSIVTTPSQFTSPFSFGGVGVGITIVGETSENGVAVGVTGVAVGVTGVAVGVTGVAVGVCVGVGVGASTIEDAQLIAQLFLGFIDVLPCPDQADVNKDGRVTINDAQLIAQLVSGTIPDFGY